MAVSVKQEMRDLESKVDVMWLEKMEWMVITMLTVMAMLRVMVMVMAMVALMALLIADADC